MKASRPEEAAIDSHRKNLDYADPPAAARALEPLASSSAEGASDAGAGAGPPTPSRRDYSFPHRPYSIQLDFMDALYGVLKKGGVGFFESPTGTGKTLSLLCGALAWLQDHRREEAAAEGPSTGPPQDSTGGIPSWMLESAAKAEKERLVRRLGALDERLKRTREREARRLAAAGLGPSGKPTATGGVFGSKRPALASAAGPQGGGSGAVDGGASGSGLGAARGEDYLLEDWEDDAGPSGAKRRATSRLALSDSDDASDGEEPPAKVQVIFASRTHSQLAQVLGEVRRAPPAAGLAVLTVGSRRALCINPEVRALGDTAAINERCLELQRDAGEATTKAKRAAVVEGVQQGAGSGRRTTGGAPVRPSPARPQSSAAASRRGCPYLTGTASLLMGRVRDASLDPSKLLDIEDLAAAGHEVGSCPYYGSRSALPYADLILCPHSAVLHRDTRDALGLSLAGNVVVLDEGHNIVEALQGAHAAQVSRAQLQAALRQAEGYLDKLGNRLGPNSLRMARILVGAIKGVLKALAGWTPGAAGAGPAPPQGPQGSGAPAPAKPPGLGTNRGGQASTSGQPSSSAPVPGTAVQVVAISSFLLASGLDQTDLPRLLRFARETRLALKVSGYATEQAAAGPGGAGGAPGAVPVDSGRRMAPILSTLSFLGCLRGTDRDGMIIVDASIKDPSGPNPSGPSLRYGLLDPSTAFGDIVRSARAVVLASGTLSPLDVLVAQLMHPKGGHEGQPAPAAVAAAQGTVAHGAAARVQAPGAPPYVHFSCGHVVDKSRLALVTLGFGPGGQTLDFRAEARAKSHDALCRELASVLGGAADLAAPGGTVVFFPSFDYLGQVVATWKATGALARLARGARGPRQVFVEPREATAIEATLAAYSEAIHGPNSKEEGAGTVQPTGGLFGSRAAQHARNGALLLGVIGGKLSEGINFGDDLGRLVVVVGLPYPNPTDPELKERMRRMGPQGGANQHMENLCMKAVNQSVGRVIRHQGDYAAVLLLDQRYAHHSRGGRLTGPLAKLPRWVGASLVGTDGTTARAMKAIEDFYASIGAGGPGRDASIS